MPSNQRTVKCTDCGFLGVRNCETREIVEVEANSRRNGGIAGFLVGQNQVKQVYEPYLICFRRAWPLRDEQLPPDRGLDKTLSDSVLAVIQKPRECSSFTKWEQGYTPREHWEMIQEAERLKWQSQREAVDKAERDRRDQEARDFQREQSNLSRRHQNRTLTVSVVAVAVAVLALLANTAIGLLK